MPLYTRVSTGEQRVEPQLHVLRSYAEARGLEVAGEYLDEGISGAKDRRPALDRLVADARRRSFDVVACMKLDRLARSVHDLTSLAREFQTLGIDLVVLDQAIDTSTPAGRLLFHVLGSIAEFERDLIRERTVAGMTSAKRKGATTPDRSISVSACGGSSSRRVPCGGRSDSPHLSRYRPAAAH